MESMTMPRRVDPLAPYRMSTHKIGKYVYASTQPATVDETTGKRKYTHLHWGSFDPEKKVFTPNVEFLMLAPEERKKYIFPSDWDLSAIAKMAGLRKPGRQHQTRHGDRLYGDIWLLEQIADKTGLRKDLLTVFDGNEEMVNMVLTLAMFPYVSRHSYNRLPRWQRIVRTPCEEPLTASHITRLTQRITTLHRDELFKLRAKRLGKNTLCAVDSTSRSAYGRSLSDVRWGKNKDRPDLPQTNEVVVYSITDHQPIYYRTFPGNMPDCRTFQIIVKALDAAGFRSLQLITDRGYETLKNLERSILDDRLLITAAPTNRALISKHIRSYGNFSAKPESMSLDLARMVYYEQFQETYVVETAKKTQKEADKLRINLFFDPEVRARQTKQQDAEILSQQELLKTLMNDREPIDDVEKLQRDCCYFELTFEDKRLSSFSLKEKKVTRERKTYGFFSLLTLGLEDDAITALDKYRLRDEQEKYFEHMKDQFGFSTQDNWSEEGKTGRLFILFVGLVLASHVRHVWKTTELRDRFDSSLAVLDEMRCIRAIETPGHQMIMTPFVSDQLEICRAFDIAVPEDCRPGYVSKQVRKRGRPRKTPVTEVGS